MRLLKNSSRRVIHVQVGAYSGTPCRMVSPNKRGPISRIVSISIAIALLLGLSIRLTSASECAPFAETSGNLVSVPEIPEGKYLYEFAWNGIPSARGEVTISMENDGGKSSYCIKGTARTSEFADIFWKFRANALALVDALSRRTTIRVSEQENARIKETETIFDYNKLEAHYQRWKKGKLRKKTLSLENDTIDPASLGLALCQKPLKVGDVNEATVLVGDDSYQLQYKVTARERITAANTEFAALRLEPSFHKIEDEKESKPPKVKQMTLWLSESEPRILLKMRSRTFIGYVTCELIQITPAIAGENLETPG